MNIFLVIVISIVIGGAAGYFGGRFSNTAHVEAGQSEFVSPARNASPAQNYDTRRDRRSQEYWEKEEERQVAAKKERVLEDRLRCLSAKAAGLNRYETESSGPAQIYSWTC